MPGTKDYQTEAIIIKKTKLGEADRILTLYTPGLGKIQASRAIDLQSGHIGKRAQPGYRHRKSVHQWFYAVENRPLADFLCALHNGTG